VPEHGQYLSTGGACLPAAAQSPYITIGKPTMVIIPEFKVRVHLACFPCISLSCASIKVWDLLTWHAESAALALTICMRACLVHAMIACLRRYSHWSTCPSYMCICVHVHHKCACAHVQVRVHAHVHICALIMYGAQAYAHTLTEDTSSSTSICPHTRAPTRIDLTSALFI